MGMEDRGGRTSGEGGEGREDQGVARGGEGEPGGMGSSEGRNNGER